jgi:hypothetical protein
MMMERMEAFLCLMAKRKTAIFVRYLYFTLLL